jgi:hypothetical protein
MKRAMVCLLLLLLVSCRISFAQRNDFPVVVARVKLTGQTEPIQRTLVFTPKSTGMFRVTAALTETIPANSDRWNARLTWSDVTGYEATIASVDTRDVLTDARAIPFLAKAGTPVRFSVDSEFGTNVGTYDLFIVIERLTKIPGF